MSRRSNGEGNISKRPDGKWTARIQIGLTEDGKPKIKAFYGSSRKEVADKKGWYIKVFMLHGTLLQVYYLRKVLM